MKLRDKIMFAVRDNVLLWGAISILKIIYINIFICQCTVLESIQDSRGRDSYLKILDNKGKIYEYRNNPKLLNPFNWDIFTEYKPNRLEEIDETI